MGVVVVSLQVYMPPSQGSVPCQGPWGPTVPPTSLPPPPSSHCFYPGESESRNSCDMSTRVGHWGGGGGGGGGGETGREGSVV